MSFVTSTGGGFLNMDLRLRRRIDSVIGCPYFVPFNPVPKMLEVMAFVDCIGNVCSVTGQRISCHLRLGGIVRGNLIREAPRRGLMVATNTFMSMARFVQFTALLWLNIWAALFSAMKTSIIKMASSTITALRTWNCGLHVSHQVNARGILWSMPDGYSPHMNLNCYFSKHIGAWALKAALLNSASLVK